MHLEGRDPYRRQYESNACSPTGGIKGITTFRFAELPSSLLTNSVAQPLYMQPSVQADDQQLSGGSDRSRRRSYLG